MWKRDHDKMKQMVNEMGSPYAAIIHTARKARQLQKSCYNVISESVAVDWAISGIPPSDVEDRVKRKLEKDKVIDGSDKLQTILDTIEEERLRLAVMNSFRASSRAKRLVFDYGEIHDRDTRARVRILTKMAFMS